MSNLDMLNLFEEYISVFSEVAQVFLIISDEGHVYQSFTKNNSHEIYKIKNAFHYVFDGFPIH